MNIAMDFQRYWLEKELAAVKKVRRIEKNDEQ